MNILDVSQYLTVRKQWDEHLKNEYSLFLEKNKKESLSLCNELVDEVVENFRLPELESSSNIRATMIGEKLNEFNRQLNYYLENAKGPAKRKL